MAEVRAKGARAGERWTPAELRRMKREATERGLHALDEAQERAKNAGITPDDVERAIREVRGLR